MYDLQFYEECVWVVISTVEENLRIGNHFSPPDGLPNSIFMYFLYRINLILKIIECFDWGILMLTILIGNADCPCLMVIIF
jgi:hypothetical protein